ncbi:unnamed protein product (macronuclear) [Paramecium tetraurelia]|uniref:Uncharacterized protein n=1 Tax=Paramecium tetraurelia TaxID=5888 RepID=A0D927_PARTE|nr:uncharacterized protein GSPATT00014490001 [Paramecium tetraurelia]CAK79544.1 unnamed protein product [Paramecium tetraurelia]|eukprot:XP_001446941.1 hypothetical protein (macronuclear) [Paramecium tetraurelia strain d4-2]
MAQDKQYKELASKLIEFILSTHKSNQQSLLQEKIAQTQKLLTNYQSQVILQQQKEIPQLNNQTQKQLTSESFKSNSITPRDTQVNNRRTSKNQSLTDKRQIQQQITSLKTQKGMQNSDSQQRLFVEHIPKMGRSLVKDDQQRNFNIITGV